MSDLTPTIPFSLRALTPARVSLARAGISLATSEILDFALAHAQARDAVYAPLESATLLDQLNQRHLDPIVLHSAAPDRPTYLRRPDLGRTLPEASRNSLRNSPPTNPAGKPRLTLILADGLSALATNRHALPLLDAVLPYLLPHFTLTPTVIAEQARVALGDPIGTLLQSDLTLILLGERPGLSSPDSLGAYLTWSPRSGRTDAERNCVSNIRAEGLDYATAAARIASLCIEASRLGLTGTALKDPTTNALSLEAPAPAPLPPVPRSAETG